MAVAVEAAAQHHHRHAAGRDLADALRQHRRALQALLAAGQFLLFLPFRGHARAVKGPDVLPAGERREGRELPPERRLAPRQHFVLRAAHGQQLGVAQLQQALQGELLVDGVRAIDRAAVRALHAGDAPAQVLLQRVVLEGGEVVEPHVGGDLEFQHGPALPQILNQLPPLLRGEVRGIEAVADAHRRHGLAGGQRLAHAAQAVGDVVPQAVVLARVDAQGEAVVLPRDLHQRVDHRTKLADVVDLLAQNIAPGHIGIAGHGADRAQAVPQGALGRDLVADDGQRNAADAREEADDDARLALDRRQHAVRLGEHERRLVRLHEGRVGDFHVPHALCRGASPDPQQLVLEERVGREVRVLLVGRHLLQRAHDVRVRDASEALQGDPLAVRLALGEDVAVEVDLLQVGEDGLPVLQDGQRGPDARQVVRRVLRVVQDEVREVDEGVVINFPVEVLAGQRRVRPALRLLRPSRREGGPLALRHAQAQLPDVIERISDLVADAQRDEDIRVEVRVHVRVQVRSELHVAEDVGLHERLADIQSVILGLAHERLRDGRDIGLALDRAVRVNVRDLGVPQPEDVHLAVGVVHIAGNLPADDLQAALVHADGQAAQPRQVRDEVARGVVRRAQGVRQRVAPAAQLDDDVLLLVQVKASEVSHGLPSSRFCRCPAGCEEQLPG